MTTIPAAALDAYAKRGPVSAAMVAQMKALGMVSTEEHKERVKNEVL